MSNAILRAMAAHLHELEKLKDGDWVKQSLDPMLVPRNALLLSCMAVNALQNPV
jgi:hypothetical protein